MDVAIGLPNAVPNAPGAELIEWARRAEAREFSSLGTIDRLVYPNYDPLIALAGAAAVTERIGLVTSVLLAPLRVNAALLAKQALGLNALSGGRFTLGVGLGGREDDYEIGDVSMEGRGKQLDAMLERMREVWSDDRFGFADPGAPRVIVGGHADASFARAARFGAGWIAGGAPADQYGGMVEKLKAAWSEAGREGEPRKLGLAYFSLGDDREANLEANLKDYYAWLGEEAASYIAGSAAKDPETVRQYIAAFADAGCDELIFFPSSSDPGQVDLLAEARDG